MMGIHCQFRLRLSGWHDRFLVEKRDEIAPDECTPNFPRSSVSCFHKQTFDAGADRSALALTTLSDSFIFLTLQRRFDLSLNLFPYCTWGSRWSTWYSPPGRLADRLEAVYLYRRVWIAGVAYGLLLLPGCPGMEPGILLCWDLCAATDGVLSALASAILPEQWRTTGLAIMTTGTGLARLLASLMYGALWTYLGPNQALSIFLLGLSITVLLAWVFWSRVERNTDEPLQ
jgi:hypothetical protein